MSEKVKLLVVDLDKSLRYMLEKELGKEGYIVATEQNSQKAMDYIELNPDTSMVLASVKLEPFDGLELLKRLKSMKPDIEVILIAVREEMELKEKAVELGVYEFIQKPYSLMGLLEILEQCVNKSR